MQFTSQEDTFLSSSHSGAETRSAGGWPELPGGMPEHIRQRCLERRAKSLGNRFAEFRSRSRAVMDDLAQRIAAAKLF